MILYAKFGQHQPLNRQSEGYARELSPIDWGHTVFDTTNPSFLHPRGPVQYHCQGHGYRVSREGTDQKAPAVSGDIICIG